jgi:arylsulfatase
VPKEWREKFTGKFDYGWDKQRELTFAKQKEMGIIPADAKLTPRPNEIPAWDSQSAEAKRVYLRLVENYAGYMAHTDHHVGRLIDSLAQSGELDDTLILYIVGDNGASPEGGLEGTFSEIASLLGVQLGLQSTLERIDEIGGPTSEPHVPVGWAWAMDAPFQWTKQVASHLGGTRNPLVVHWPKGIRAKGELRTQFHHVIDVVPTILEACKIPAPNEVDGIPQKPIEGVSMLYSFDDGAAKGRRTTQYFEMMTNRAIYKDGWMAASHFGVPWDTAGRKGDFADAPWELYHLDADFSQADDLAAQQPQKLEELKQQFLVEAKRYDVLPLDPRMAERFDPRNRIAGEPRTSWTYYGNAVRLPEPASPLIFPPSHSITTEVVVPKGGAKGVIAACGGYSSGWTLYVQDGKPHFAYTFFDLANSQIDGATVLPEGKVTLKTEYSAVGPMEQGGTLRLFVNDKPAGEGRIQRVGFRSCGLEPFEVGRDSITPVTRRYAGQGAFPFNGQIERISFQLSSEAPH